jgi:hypothetical protein
MRPKAKGSIAFRPSESAPSQGKLHPNPYKKHLDAQTGPATGKMSTLKTRRQQGWCRVVDSRRVLTFLTGVVVKRLSSEGMRAEVLAEGTKAVATRPVDRDSGGVSPYFLLVQWSDASGQ